MLTFGKVIKCVVTSCKTIILRHHQLKICIFMIDDVIKNDIFRKKIKVTLKLIREVLSMQTLKHSVFHVLKIIF